MVKRPDIRNIDIRAHPSLRDPRSPTVPIVNPNIWLQAQVYSTAIRRFQSGKAAAQTIISETIHLAGTSLVGSFIGMISEYVAGLALIVDFRGCNSGCSNNRVGG